MTHFDLAIIGSGSGNSLVTPDFDGKSVAIIEKGLFGGTCLNVGCIPTKMYVYAAEVADTVRDASRYGVDAHVDGIRWPAIRDRIFGRIDPISQGGRDYRVNGANTTAYLGEGRFTGPKTLTVTVDGREEEVSADQIVLASGSHAVVPDEITASGVPFHTSDTVMRMEQLPSSMVILGGGFIAAEFAHVFSALGVAVKIVARGKQLLTKEDADISAAFTEQAEQKWDVHLGSPPERAEAVDGGVELTLGNGTRVRGEVLLVATGRAPNSPSLDLDVAGVDTYPDGRIVVDPHGRTSAEGIWSLGDASSPYQLKHVANHEARIVAHNLAHPHDLYSFDHRFVPQAVFTHPQISSVGLTEEQARATGRDITVKVQKYGDVAFGWAMEDTTSMVKLIADKKTKLLIGAHFLGPDASSLIQTSIQAMSFGLTVPQMARGQYWIHPALAEVVENALLGLEFDD
ncbi:mycothione reductase [Allobranchiibius sp. GilTou73]|uniref:mycothione reductase n=1 Tax=Allobranchiibius sp. GilTou73 TaxID=2904523 RepID=UPI001F41F89B|nr:mycothione reductase [Allobranchiibius sp. GilTou73]UIJ34612.1 mycothione reductase [Allobranchiibius sp. GilTou73]